MHIENIHLENYRCFATLGVKFHPQMTVLVAPNGQGKTSILDAIKVALWPFVAGFDLGSTANDNTGIHIDDVRKEQIESHEMDWRLPSEIHAIGQLQVRRLIQDGTLENPIPPTEASSFDIAVMSAENVPWQCVRSRTSIKKGTRSKDISISGALNLDTTANALEQRIFSGNQSSPDNLPMLGYYGTGRLSAQKGLTAADDKADNETQSRTFAYRDCLKPASNYRHFAQWFSRVHKSYFQAQMRNFEKGRPFDADVPYGLIAPFKAVQKTVDTILKPHTGWHTLEYSAEHDELVLNHDQQGELKVSQLSDGIRNMLALVGDIAYRCYKLNAHLGEDAPRRTAGIVMIDEVDMHIHPGWQQTVLTDLMAAFPKLQFIVTTHSPQVLTSVDASCIRLLRQEIAQDSNKRTTVVETIAQQTRGVASSDVLAAIMGVDPIPDVPEARQLAQYHALIQQNLHTAEEGLALRGELDLHFGKDHPVMLDCDRIIRLQAFKQRLPLPKGAD